MQWHVQFRHPRLHLQRQTCPHRDYYQVILLWCDGFVIARDETRLENGTPYFGAEMRSANKNTAPWAQFPPGGEHDSHIAPWRRIPCTEQALSLRTKTRLPKPRSLVEKTAVGKWGGYSKYLGRQWSGICLRGKNWRCLVRSVEYPELTPRSTMRQQRRINRSMGDEAYEAVHRIERQATGGNARTIK